MQRLISFIRLLVMRFSSTCIPYHPATQMQMLSPNSVINIIISAAAYFVNTFKKVSCLFL